MFKRAQSVTLNIKIYKTNIVFCDVTNQNMFKHTTVLLSFNPFLQQQGKKIANKIVEIQAFMHNSTSTNELFIPFWLLGFWLFLVTKLPKYYVIVCLLFTEQGKTGNDFKVKKISNHTTKMKKKPKTKLPFVMSRA